MFKWVVALRFTMQVYRPLLASFASWDKLNMVRLVNKRQHVMPVLHFRKLMHDGCCPQVSYSLEGR